MAESATLDLVRSPWIRVLDRDGTVEEVSIVDGFARSHELKGLAGEVATQDAAILRLLLAVLHRVAEEAPGYPVDIWSHWWESPTLPLEHITAYLERVGGRFDLFDPVAPFLQVADLQGSKTSGLGKLIADVPDGQAYFTTRAGASLESLRPEEAARWLVHCHAYDPSGIKTGAIGDPRVKRGKGYPIGTGWAGRCGLVIIEGETLKETLLLNLALGRSDADGDPDLPVWERAPLGPAVERRHPEPLGPADIMTWPTRRIRLMGDGERVTDVLLTNGDAIHPANRHTVETMTAWRRSAHQEKQSGVEPTYMPRRHDPSRALWRGLAGLLADLPAGGRVGDDAPIDRPPETLRWLADLCAGGFLDPDRRLRLHAVGVSYGTQDASIDSVYDDMLVFSVAVASDPNLKSEALAAAGTGEHVANLAGHLAANLARASGRDTEGPRARALEEAFHTVGLAYAAWLSQLDLLTDLSVATHRWERTLQTLLLPLGERLVHDAGEIAWLGRGVSRPGRDNRNEWIDSALAWHWFRDGMRKALPALTSTEQPTIKAKDVMA